MDERKMYRITIEDWDDYNKRFIAHRIHIACDPSKLRDVLYSIRDNVNYYKAETQSKLCGMSMKR